MDLLPIPKLGYLASCAMDGKVALWSVSHIEQNGAARAGRGEESKQEYDHGVPNRKIKVQKKHEFTQGHKLGVHTLVWLADMSMIISAGLDHDIYLWNPQVKPRVFVMKGHNHSLVGVKWVKGTLSIVSADISGMIRVWDMRNYTTTQTINCTLLNELNTVEVTLNPKRIIIGGRSLVFYDYDEPVDHHLAD